jgi:hypothetical protein
MVADLGMVGFNDGRGESGVKTTLNRQLCDENAWKVNLDCNILNEGEPLLTMVFQNPSLDLQTILL